MQGIVTGPFHTPQDADPPKSRVQPSANPDKPTIVDVPPWCYKRQTELGNLQGVDEYSMRRELEADTRRKVAELEAEAERLRARALLEADRRVLTEEIDGLADLDKDSLVGVARNHKLTNIPTKGNDKTIAAAVKRGLVKKLDDLSGKIADLDAFSDDEVHDESGVDAD